MRFSNSFQQPPRTAVEVYSLLPEGTRCEVVENQLYMRPAPIRKHQRISGIIQSKLFAFVEENGLGEVYDAPTDVYIDEKNIFQPDIFFVSNKNRKALTYKGIEGAPDLVIEILSPSNSDHDSVRKKAVYERCGVKEFWIIDLEARSVHGFILNKGKYQSIGRASRALRFKTFDFAIDLSKEL